MRSVVDICDEIKQARQMREVIELPLTNPELFKRVASPDMGGQLDYLGSKLNSKISFQV